MVQPHYISINAVGRHQRPIKRHPNLPSVGVPAERELILTIHPDMSHGRVVAKEDFWFFLFIQEHVYAIDTMDYEGAQIDPLIN